MNSNLLIVESENDKYFIKALIEYLKISIEIDSPICNIDDYECLKGLGSLESKFNQIKTKIKKDNILKIGH